jgi:hypothetical protein
VTNAPRFARGTSAAERAFFSGNCPIVPCRVHEIGRAHAAVRFAWTRPTMALMSPREFPARDLVAAAEDALIFDALRTGPDDAWWVFYDRIVQAGGETGRIDFVLLHAQRGVLCLAVAGADLEIDAASAESAVATMLREAGFPGLFGELPTIAALAVAPDRADGLAARIEAALPVRSDGGPSDADWPDDPDWVEWVADRLAVASDLAPDPPPPPETTDEETADDGAMVAPRRPVSRHRRLLICAGIAGLGGVLATVALAGKPWTIAAQSPSVAPAAEVLEPVEPPPGYATRDAPPQTEASLPETVPAVAPQVEQAVAPQVEPATAPQVAPQVAPAAASDSTVVTLASKPHVIPAEAARSRAAQDGHHPTRKRHHHVAWRSWWDRLLVALR